MKKGTHISNPTKQTKCTCDRTSF